MITEKQIKDLHFKGIFCQVKKGRQIRFSDKFALFTDLQKIYTSAIQKAESQTAQEAAAAEEAAGNVCKVSLWRLRQSWQGWLNLTRVL